MTVESCLMKHIYWIMGDGLPQCYVHTQRKGYANDLRYLCQCKFYLLYKIPLPSSNYNLAGQDLKTQYLGRHAPSGYNATQFFLVSNHCAKQFYTQIKFLFVNLYLCFCFQHGNSFNIPQRNRIYLIVNTCLLVSFHSV